MVFRGFKVKIKFVEPIAGTLPAEERYLRETVIRMCYGDESLAKEIEKLYQNIVNRALEICKKKIGNVDPISLRIL